MSVAQASKSTIGTRIRFAVGRAKDRGEAVSARDVARLIGVSASTFQSMQRPTFNRPRDLTAIRKLATALNASFEWLLTGSDPQVLERPAAESPAVPTPTTTNPSSSLLAELAAQGLVVMSVESLAKLLREVK